MNKNMKAIKKEKKHVKTHFNALPSNLKAIYQLNSNKAERLTNKQKKNIEVIKNLWQQQF